MQFKLLAAALLASSVAAEYDNYMDCLVKKECKKDVPCVNECFQAEKSKPDQLEVFILCNSGRCIKEGGVTKDTTDWTKYYECSAKCYNNCIGNPNGTPVDLKAKASDKKEEGNNTTTNKSPAPAAGNNASKIVPSVVASLILASLAL